MQKGVLENDLEVLDINDLMIAIGDAFDIVPARYISGGRIAS